MLAPTQMQMQRVNNSHRHLNLADQESDIHTPPCPPSGLTKHVSLQDAKTKPLSTPQSHAATPSCGLSRPSLLSPTVVDSTQEP